MSKHQAESARVPSVLGMVEALDRAAPRCPRCNSPHPSRHPAAQFEGEVQVCPHPWHFPTDSEATS